MTDNAAFLRAFALGMLAKAELWQSATLSRPQKSAVRASLGQEIRKFHDFWLREVDHPAASKAARAAADSAGIDLCRLGWLPSQRTNASASHQFLLEHQDTVGSLTTRLLACANLSEVEGLLRGTRVVWVLREEDARLRQGRHHVVRPDPDAAYTAVRITVVPCPHGAISKDSQAEQDVDDPVLVGEDADPLNDFCDACGARPAEPCRRGCTGHAAARGQAEGDEEIVLGRTSGGSPLVVFPRDFGSRSNS